MGNGILGNGILGEAAFSVSQKVVSILDVQLRSSQNLVTKLVKGSLPHSSPHPYFPATYTFLSPILLHQYDVIEVGCVQKQVSGGAMWEIVVAKL